MTSKGRKKTSRRGFIQGVAISTAAVSAAELLKKEVADAASIGDDQAIPLQSTEFDFIQKSAALEPDKIVDSACQFCNSLCRLKVHLKDGRIIDVLGEPNDPVQAGGFCIKGPMMTQLVYNRFRLKSPMKRVGGNKGDSNSKFEPISWDEALSIIASKFLALRDAGIARAIANKTSGRLPRGTGSLVGRYFSMLGSPNNTDVGPVCNDAGGNALAWTFGLGNFTNGYGIDDAIISGEPYQLKAIVTQGNPLLACSDTIKVQQAYRQLEFYVYTGLFMEESAYYADIILPVTSGFEMETVYMRRDDRAIRWQEQVVSPVGESKPDWHIWIDLAHATAKLDKRNPPEYWRDNFPDSWKDYRQLWATFLTNTPGMGGMTQQRLSQRTEPLRWPCPTVEHPGVSTLYLDHASWYEAASSLNPKNVGKRFLTPSGKVEIYTPQLQSRLAESGHSALPSFYTHPEVTGKHPTIEYTSELVKNPVNPQALTQNIKFGKISSGEVHKQYPLMGMTGRSSVVHFHSVTHWTYTGKQMNGVRLVQIHPKEAKKAGIKNGDEIIVESPRGSIIGTALVWSGIREDTIFVPSWFGPGQKMAEEFGTPYYESVNILIDKQYYDNLSGQQAFKCFACRVKKA
ncbi:molybdopterin-dependent oxidoreductase [Nostoc sp. XA010]|uniref:molybdopterin-containing oxidoreductase family protein n=1 Tax=Nostoc sp. XA010 TaxID=2780407 RepID=UPI001E503974|nr:molybdopterin-dependent oxidoreductase [Nostoc sp. XA010]MCC5660854.1 molybdopterin-dependent oxidoreductase [Nostoc sp. XA010]